MVATVHDDAAGEVALPLASAFSVPSSLVASLGLRAFRYVVPDNSASGAKAELGWATTQNATATTTPVPTTADLRQSLVRNQMTSSNANTLVGISQNPGVGSTIFRGDKAGVGGFFLAWCLSFPQMAADSIIRIGVVATNPAGGNEPSALANSCVFGADSGDANLTLISVDNGGASNKSASVMTKASLATGDPNSGSSRVLLFKMYAPPNAGAITCSIDDISSGVPVLAPTDVTTRLPLNTQALRMWAAGSTKTAAAHTQALLYAYGYY